MPDPTPFPMPVVIPGEEEAAETVTAPSADGGFQNPLAALRAEATKTVAVPTTTLSVPGRPDFAAVFRYDMGQPDLERIAKLRSVATRKGGKTGSPFEKADDLQFGLVLLATYSQGVLYRGEPVQASDTGEPMTFRSPEFIALFDQKGVGRSADAVHGFYSGRDIAILGSMGRLFEKASGEVEELDPTAE